MLTYILLLFSLPVYMFRFRLLLLFIIVGPTSYFKFILAYAFILLCLVAVCQRELVLIDRLIVGYLLPSPVWCLWCRDRERDRIGLT